MTPLPALIVEARVHAGYNQAEWARRLGVTTRAVQRWEAGDRAPRPRYLRMMAMMSGHPVAWFYPTTTTTTEAP